MKKMPISKTPSEENNNVTDDLQSEYQFDYSQARPNRFADRMGPDSIIVVLDPDVAEVFKRPEAVNNVLRALIATMPTPAE